MREEFAPRRTAAATPSELVRSDAFQKWRRGQSKTVRAWLDRSGFEGRSGSHVVVPGTGRAKARIVAAVEGPSIWWLAGLPQALADGTYYLDSPVEDSEATRLSIGWGLGSYAFDRYRAAPRARRSRFVLPSNADAAEVARHIDAASMARDLINTPAGDLGPPELAEAARELARRYGAKVKVVEGSALERGFPAVHAVGRAAAKAPRLIDFTWGTPRAPKVTLVGKGVCFDTGGLNLKTGNGMRLMKKDMGGAATVLALGQLIMDAGLPVRLRVLVPAVENNVAGNAYRPGDVVRTRKGVTVEIGNTDAEGRVILADALALADEESPDLLIDCATLTGAARVALGTDLPALFCDDDGFADSLAGAGAAEADPVWRLPLWAPYRRYIESPIADINNAGSSPFGGAITAALFLNRFVDNAKVWAHLDLFGWNEDNRPGRPKGGEAMTVRALLRTLRTRYGAA